MDVYMATVFNNIAIDVERDLCFVEGLTDKSIEPKGSFRAFRLNGKYYFNKYYGENKWFWVCDRVTLNWYFREEYDEDYGFHTYVNDSTKPVNIRIMTRLPGKRIEEYLKRGK